MDTDVRMDTTAMALANARIGCEYHTINGIQNFMDECHNILLSGDWFILMRAAAKIEPLCKIINESFDMTEIDNTVKQLTVPGPDGMGLCNIIYVAQVLGHRGLWETYCEKRKAAKASGDAE